MTRVFCDVCGKEKPTSKVDIPVHLYSMRSSCGYVDSEFNKISGRHDSIDMCNKCLNVAYISLLKGVGLWK
jgi:hypothetical protein